MLSKMISWAGTVFLVFLLTCPFPSLCTLPARATAISTLAPGTLSERNLLENYEDMDSGLIVRQTGFLQREKAMAGLGQPLVEESGVVVMNSAGAELFEKCRQSKSAMRTAVFAGTRKQFIKKEFMPNSFGVPVPVIPNRPVLKNAEQGICITSGLRVYDEAQFKDLRLPSCVVPFFIDPAMSFRPNGLGKSKVSQSVFVRRLTKPIGEYIAGNKLSEAQVRKLFSGLLRAVDEYLASDLGQLAGLRLDSFEIDPLTGKIYFVAIEAALKLYADGRTSGARADYGRFDSRDAFVAALMENGLVDVGFLNYFKFVVDAEEVDARDAEFISAWNDYKAALLKAGPGNDSRQDKEYVGPRTILVESETEAPIIDAYGGEQAVYERVIDPDNPEIYKPVLRVGPQDAARQQAHYAFAERFIKLMGGFAGRLPKQFVKNPYNEISLRFGGRDDDDALRAYRHAIIGNSLGEHSRLSSAYADSEAYFFMHKDFMEGLYLVLERRASHGVGAIVTAA